MMERSQIIKILEQKVFPLIQKPGRYIGGEVNSTVKDVNEIAVRIALAFPDVYELGMSNLGLKILYEIINNQPRYYAERVFCPWPDLEKYLRADNIPLFSLETHSALKEFDILGFSLQYELAYSNILNILDLGGIPLYAEDRRRGNWPLVIAGGPLAVTPEPLAPFIDVFVIGDGEEVILEILRCYERYKTTGDKNKLLPDLAATVTGVYVPGLYQAAADGKGRLTKFIPENNNLPLPIPKRLIPDLDAAYLPKKPIIPLIDTVHNRANLEIMRGCPHHCRFCQARVIYRPFRKRSPELLKATARELIRNTGFQEISFAGLSCMDYPDIENLAADLLPEWTNQRVSISLPSMRIDSFSLELIDKISQVKKTGITLAPEAGSDKLLKLLNKDYRADDLITVAGQAFRLGYKLIKLYFMIGLPEEETSDLDSIVALVLQLADLGRKINGHPVQLHLAIATFVPKAHTPFQFYEMTRLAEIREKQRYILSRLKRRNFKISFHSAEQSILEAVFTRGDRNLARVIETAWRLGCKFDQWLEYFRYDLWQQAFLNTGSDMATYLSGWAHGDSLPWGHIDTTGKNCQK